MGHNLALLRLLQLCNSSLPVGAYSYSEGLETLCTQEIITTAADLENWLGAELRHGSILGETAVMIRAYQNRNRPESISLWNHWYTASRETEELRLQSLQMGRSLLKLLSDLEPKLHLEGIAPRSCNYCIAYGIAANHWEIDLEAAILGYLQSWVTNLVSAGIKLIPLGQTQGQQVILQLTEAIANATERVMHWSDDDLDSNSWGLQLASMAHETLYSTACFSVDACDSGTRTGGGEVCLPIR